MNVKKYKICGIDIRNKRFVIHTNNPQHYNIYKGNLWEKQEDGKWKLIHRYNN